MTLHSSPNLRLSLQNSKKILLAQEPLGIGGEGRVYEVVSPVCRKGYVAKIFHPKERTSEREKKLAYMLLHRPELPKDHSVIWVEDLLYEEDKFVGYLMKKAPGTYDLTVLSSLKISSKLPDNWHHKYTRKLVTGFLYRCNICRHIARAVHQLHRTGHYVLVDMKPENIRISLCGKVSLLDLDSIEIVENGKLLYAAEKVSNEYSPAEVQTMNLQTDVIPETWDRFSMGVIFYKILFGLHPYTGTPGAVYSKFVSYAQKIQAGLLPLGKRAADFEVIPTPHQNFQVLPPNIQQLFLDCLETGYNTPKKRPSAQTWTEAFHQPELRFHLYHNPTLLSLTSPSVHTQHFRISSPTFVKEYTPLMGYVLGIAIASSFFWKQLEEDIGLFLGLLTAIASLFLGGILFLSKKLLCIEVNPIRRHITMYYRSLFHKKIQKTFDLDELNSELKEVSRERTWLGSDGNVTKILKIFKPDPWLGERELGRIKVGRDQKNKEVVDRLKKILEKMGLIDI